MHADPIDGLGPIGQEIVRSAWQHAESGGNDRTTGLAWAAGFFDGEGYIGINSARRSRNMTRAFTLVLSMANVDERPIRRFADIVGEGQIYWYPSYQANHSGKSIWSTSGPAAMRTLELLRPYLWGKHEQADIAIHFQGTKGRRGVALTDDEFEYQRSMQQHLRSLRSEIKARANR